MAFGYAAHPDLVINLNSTVSQTITLIEDAYGLSITAPPNLDSSTISVAVAGSTASGANLSVLQSGGTDVTLSAGKALVITPVPFKQLQLQAFKTETAQRNFNVAKVF